MNKLLNFLFLKVKNIYTYLLIIFVDCFVKKICKPKLFCSKSLFIIRLDEIGDYLLFHNFIKYIKNSKRYKDYHITLVGNAAWKELAEEFEKLSYIWVDKKSFAYNPIYRLKKLCECRRKKYEILFNPTYEQNIIYDASLANVVEAEYKSGCSGHIKRWTKKIIRFFYNDFFITNFDDYFQFYINKDIVSHFIGENINITRLEIKLGKTYFKDRPAWFNKPYIVFFIGASIEEKRWDIKKFIKLAKYFEANGFTVILCGGKSEEKSFKHNLNNLMPNIFNCVGKLSLLQTAEVIDKALLLLTNDTCAAHFGMSLNTKNVVVMANGSGYPFFYPYPKEFGRKYTLIMPQISENKCVADINLIQYDTVKNIVYDIIAD